MSTKNQAPGKTARSGRRYRFDLDAIATLSNHEIREKMTDGELIEVIRSVEYPFAGKERLEFFDRDTLERVVCLVRRWTCHQLGKPTL